MSRIKIKEIKKRETRNKFIKTTGIYVTLFIMISIATFACFINNENKKVCNFILTYDKNKTVYNLQQDFKGGNF